MVIIIEHSAWLDINLSKALKIACLHLTLSQTADTLAKKIVNTFSKKSNSMMDILADRSKYISCIAPELYQITEQQLLCMFHLFSNLLHLGLHSIFCLTAQDYKPDTSSGKLLTKVGQKFPSLAQHLHNLM